MQQAHAAQLPLLGGATAWSLLDLNPRLKRLHYICRERGDSEVTASAFAEATISSVFDTINQRRTANGQHALQFDFVSQQPPDKQSRRRIDSQVVGWTATEVKHQNKVFSVHNPFVLAHIEVKRHNAAPNEVETLEGQIVTAAEATAQSMVYGIAFHGTAMRAWQWERNILHALTGNDSHDVEDKTNWIDAEERGTASVALLGAFLAMVASSPYPLLAKSSMPMQMPNQQVWALAEGLFIEIASKVPIPRSALVTGEIVVISGQRFRLPSAAVAQFKETVIDQRRPDWKSFANAYAISVPAASTYFEQARKLASKGEHGKARKYAARAYMEIGRRGAQTAAAGPSRPVIAGPSRAVAAGPSRATGAQLLYRRDEDAGQDDEDSEDSEDSDEESDDE